MNMTVRYKHAHSPHSVVGAHAALSKIFVDIRPDSLMDVGCGTGTWLKAANQLGVFDLHGIDAIDIFSTECPQASFSKLDLTKSFNLGRRYGVVLCLEVAEHLNVEYASVLVQSLVTHAPRVIFSAACPGQPGQQHVNCQWPDYWQALFNKHGFVCDDSIRWLIWRDKQIEPWYRQNVFSAVHAPTIAGQEPRIAPVIHPDMLPVMFGLSRYVPSKLLPGLRWLRSMAEQVLG